MTSQRLASLLLLASCLAAPVNGMVGGGEAFTFSKRTTLITDRSGYGTFYNAGVDTSLTAVALETDSPSVVVIIRGPAGSYWTLLINGYRLGEDSPDLLAVPHGGPYHVYVVGSSRVVTTLMFRDLDGAVNWSLRPNDGAAMDLHPMLDLTKDGLGIQRRVGTQPFEGVAYSLIGTVQRVLAPGEFHTELRWSTPDGIVECWSFLTGGAGTLPFWSQWATGTFSFSGHRLPMNLTVFRHSAAVMTDVSMVGYWVKRVPGDGPTFTTLVKPTGWSITDGDPMLDQDFGCVRSLAEQTGNAVVAANTNRPVYLKGGPPGDVAWKMSAVTLPP